MLVNRKGWCIGEAATAIKLVCNLRACMHAIASEEGTVAPAADLVHMLTMAHQELPPELLALARKDSKFRNGSSGKRGGRGGGGGGSGARRRPVGGAGLGFAADTQQPSAAPGATPYMNGTYCREPG